MAYAGVFEIAQKRGYKFANITGVSVGGVAGVCAAAGLKTQEMLKIIDEFSLPKVDSDKIPEKVPAVKRVMKVINKSVKHDENIIKSFLLMGEDADLTDFADLYEKLLDLKDYRMNLIKNILEYSKKGSLFDGDYLEEWMAKLLARKGIRTFADLRGGVKDAKNPNGYKVRMTAVDCNRMKVIVLPDDISYYGIDPDKLEVAKAIRMTTCVPFAFKPVEIKRNDGDKIKTHYIVDGGVFDRLPSWLLENSEKCPVVAFVLEGKGDKGLFSINTPLAVFKALVSAVHDIGIPKNWDSGLKYVGKIDVGDIHALDFDIDKDKRKYLYESGKKTALSLFNELEKSLK